jgi:putative ABC transport system permease protein
VSRWPLQGSPVFAVLAAQLRDRPLRLAVTIGAIALGIALTAGVYFVNASALAEFARATRYLSGAADLVIDGGRAGLDEALYPAFARRPGVALASPALELELALERGGTLTVLGVDPLLAGRMQPGVYGELAGHFLALLEPDAIALSAAAAAALGLAEGAVLEARVGPELRRLRVVAVLADAGSGRRFGAMDIGTAQWALGRLGRLTRIELRLEPGTDPARFAAALALPPGVVAATPALAEARAATLTRAYRVNLNMLALVALLSGAFLVFATQAQSTLRRRASFGLLRALGARRGEIAGAVLLEGALVGAAGGILGTVLGALIAALVLERLGGDLGAGLLGGATLHLAATPLAALGFVALGVAVSVAGSWLPARRLAAQPTAQALKGGDPVVAPAAARGARLALALVAAGGLAALAPPVAGLPLGGYAAIALLVFGAVLLVPAFATRALPRLSWRRGAIGRLALARLEGTVAQSSISLAAIVVSFSLMVAMAIMVHSFRDSFERWLGQVLPADLYLRVAFGSDTSFLGPAESAAAAALPGVARVEFRRQRPLLLDAARPPLALIARPLDADYLARLPLVARARGLPAGVPVAYVSEAVRDLYAATPGARLELPIGGARHAVVVAGVWRDYARSSGTVVIDLATYRSWSGDATVNEGSVWLAPGHAAAAVEVELRARLAMGASLEFIEAPALKERSLAAFDRAFAITYALEAIAVAIGLAGVAFAFASQALARRAEFGVLRHVGCSRRELAQLLAGEGALLGTLGALYGLLVGSVLSLVLVYVVNRQSFHWSLDFVVPAGQLTLAAAALVLAAAVTARLAARTLLTGAAVRAVREDW